MCTVVTVVVARTLSDVTLPSTISDHSCGCKDPVYNDFCPPRLVITVVAVKTLSGDFCPPRLVITAVVLFMDTVYGDFALHT